MDPSGAMFSKSYKGALPLLTPAPAEEARMLTNIQHKSYQLLVIKLMGTTKSQLCTLLFIFLICANPGLFCFYYFTVKLITTMIHKLGIQ